MPCRNPSSDPVLNAIRRYAPLVGVILTGCAVSPGPSPRQTTAIPALEARFARDSLDSKTTLSLAEAYRSTGRLAEAAALLERTVQRGPNSSALAMLGLTYEELERYGDERRRTRGTSPARSDHRCARRCADVCS